MKEAIAKINWKELFFPVFFDIKNIGEESDSNRVSANNWSLADNDTDYEQFKKKIKSQSESLEGGINNTF